MSYRGKAIYNPSGKAGEYSLWACNFYVGCSNECTYCYLKKGRSKQILGGNTPKLKEYFKNELHALEVFKSEIKRHREDLQKHGLFFSFTTDPMLNETIGLTLSAVYECQELDIPVKILTKTVERFPWFIHKCKKYALDLSKIAIGVSLTGADHLEPNADPNGARVLNLQVAHKAGFRTFASIEPTITFNDSLRMISLIGPYCDLIKVGLESGAKYDVVEAQTFVEVLSELEGTRIYLKESLQKLTYYTNAELGAPFVERDYNMFNFD